MRKAGTKNIRPVDEDHQQVHEHPDRQRMVALEDRNLFNMRIKSERASAYWFAASVWGVTGLVLGGILGAFMMYVAMDSSLPLASEAVTRGMAVEQARQSVNNRAPMLVDPDQPAQQPEQQQR
ncbi:hypothetical protein [Terricaulis sp.]|uniref:hypothetical protein n=1 Tax=Terricaulis sp. TaxID=2768686 RepID=UPI002AC37524|nr:hypothetical protein [Terricaulis sp.]MDZ4691160.1 hypothetical protein [Terricaulis sp.]